MTAMMIVMQRDCSPEAVAAVVSRLEDRGCEIHVSDGQERVVIGAMGAGTDLEQLPWEAMEGVEQAVPVLKPFTFVSRDFQEVDSIVTVGDVPIGGNRFTVVAGPCAVESREQLFRTAELVVKAGATILRGDAFKPRTSPYAFQGLAEQGLELMAAAREEFGVPFVAEVLDPRDVELVASYADMLRVGTRNMSNYPLLAEVGSQPKPVQLKRGFTATIEDWLHAAEIIYKEGNHQIVLVERGIRTFETAARNTLDISAVPIVQRLSHLPIMVDPSHSGGHRYLVAPLAQAAVGVRASGIMVDVHPAPDTALVDGDQALLPSDFSELMDRVRKLVAAVDLEM